MHKRRNGSQLTWMAGWMGAVYFYFGRGRWKGRGTCSNTSHFHCKPSVAEHGFVYILQTEPCKIRVLKS
jgi:hypothetical protein